MGERLEGILSWDAKRKRERENEGIMDYRWREKTDGSDHVKEDLGILQEKLLKGVTGGWMEGWRGKMEKETMDGEYEKNR